MLVTTLIGLIVVFLAWLEDRKVLKHGLMLSFILIFLFLAFRFKFGNDYLPYYKLFIEINSYEEFDLMDPTIRAEPAWILLCRIFRPLGFFFMIAALALLNCCAYYHFIKKFVPEKFYWLAVFLYVFSTGFLLVQSSSMRQTVGINLFLISLGYLNRKDFVRYFLCAAVAAFFHTSALILIPVFLLSLFNWRINGITAIFIVTIFLLLFMYGIYLLPVLNEIISTHFERYEVYQDSETAKLGSGVGFVYLCFLFLLIIHFEKFQNREISLLFKLAILSFLFIPTGFIFMMFARISMYFSPAIIVVYPVIISNIQKNLYKKAVLYTIIFFTAYGFYQFFQSETWKDAFGVYHTIFSAPEFM